MSLNGTLKALSDPIRRNILTMLKGKKMIAGIRVGHDADAVIDHNVVVYTFASLQTPRVANYVSEVGALGNAFFPDTGSRLGCLRIAYDIIKLCHFDESPQPPTLGSDVFSPGALAVVTSSSSAIADSTRVFAPDTRVSSRLTC